MLQPTRDNIVEALNIQGRVKSLTCNGSSGSFVTSSIPVPPNTFDLLKISRSIDALPLLLKSSAYFAYSDNWQATEVIAIEVWDRVNREQKPTKGILLQGLILLAMQNWKYRIATSKDKYSIKALCELLEISAKNWQRTWRKYWQRVQAIVEEIDDTMFRNILT